MTYEPLEPMLQEAEAKKLWLRCTYQDLWFAPAELRVQQTAGHFRWGPVNWKLVNPAAHVAELQHRIASAQVEYDAFVKRVAASGEDTPT